MDDERIIDNRLSSLNSVNDDFIKDYFNDDNDEIDIQEVVDEFGKEKNDEIETSNIIKEEIQKDKVLYDDKEDFIKYGNLEKISRMSSEDILDLIDSTSNSEEFFEEIESKLHD